MAEAGQLVSIDGRTLRLRNLDKELYPASGFTKAHVIDYYVNVADAMLPGLAGRPVTLRRYPDGVDSEGFFEKNVSRHAPDWVRTVRMAAPGSARGTAVADFPLVEDRATLAWVANLAGLELHVPQWTVGEDNTRNVPDLLVLDLDPGHQASIVQCCRVAELLKAELSADGLTAWPKTSGSKGLQMYAPVTADEPGATSRYAKALAERLARTHPKLVVAHQAKADRTGKVLIDWSQNNPAKTTVAAYSLRARPRPTVSTPVVWAEVTTCTDAAELVFTADDVRRRLSEHGDLLDGLHADPRPLPDPPG